MFFLIASLLLSLSVLSFGQQNAALAAAKDDTPSETDILLNAVTQTQDSQGEWKYLIGAAKIRTSEMTITADEIDFNQDTAWAYARGHVHLVHYATGDVLNADHGEYNLKSALRPVVDKVELRARLNLALAEKPPEHEFRNNWQPKRIMTAIGG